MSWCQILQPFQFFFLFNWYFFPFESCFHVTHLVTGNDYNTRVKAAILLVPKSAWLSSLWLSSTIASSPVYLHWTLNPAKALASHFISWQAKGAAISQDSVLATK